MSLKVLKSRAIRLKTVPKGVPQVQDFEFFDENVEEKGLKENELLVELQQVSVDPYIRGRLPQYHNKVLESLGIAKVLASKDAKFKENDIITGTFPWRTYSIVNGAVANAQTKDLITKHKNEFPLAYWLGILGMTGMTAYYGLLDVGKCQENEKVFVSGAAGAVGIVVGQLAKKIKKCYVVGSAGGDAKCKYLKEDLAFDNAIDYQKFNNNAKQFQEELKKMFPNGIDVYFDNTGGFVTESVWDLLNKNARVVICGQISIYNNRDNVPKIDDFLFKLIYKHIRVEGFVVSDFKNYPEFYGNMIQWIQKGSLSSKETILNGFGKIPQGFIDLFSGVNTGKMVIDCTKKEKEEESKNDA